MAADDQTSTRGTPKRKRRDRAADSSPEPTGGVARWVVLGMMLVALGCLAVGSLQHGFDLKAFLAAAACLATGVGFVAIGLLELEWLERIIGFVDGILSGVAQWVWSTWSGSLADSELLGRRGATVIWVGVGVPLFVWGCLMGLRVIGI